MFIVKEYDLGDQVEKVGYYQDVVDSMQASKNREFDSNATLKIKHEKSEEVKQEQNKERSIQRSRTKIRRLAAKHNMRYMWTLTFAKKMVTTHNPNGQVKEYDAGDYEDAWTLWKNFLKRCKRAGMEFDYIVTIEVQEKRLEQYGEKVYHFHFITNKQIPVNAERAKRQGKKVHMQGLWKHGHVHVSLKKSSKKTVYRYIVKYIAKVIEEMGSGKQRYRVSNGLGITVQVKAFTDHVKFFMENEGAVASSNYSLLADTLEIFWMITDKFEEEPT